MQTYAYIYMSFHTLYMQYEANCLMTALDTVCNQYLNSAARAVNKNKAKPYNAITFCIVFIS